MAQGTCCKRWHHFLIATVLSYARLKGVVVKGGVVFAICGMPSFTHKLHRALLTFNLKIKQMEE